MHLQIDVVRSLEPEDLLSIQGVYQWFLDCAVIGDFVRRTANAVVA